MHTLPVLRARGGGVILLGSGHRFLIGPAEERWDLTTRVRQHSIEAFMAFASNAEYLAGLGHRVAAVEDSRLLPLTELPLATTPACDGRP